MGKNKKGYQNALQSISIAKKQEQVIELDSVEVKLLRELKVGLIDAFLESKTSLRMEEVRVLLNSPESVGLRAFVVLLMNYQAFPQKKHLMQACLQLGTTAGSSVSHLVEILPLMQQEIRECTDIERLTTVLMRKSHYQFQVFLDLYSVAEQRQEQLIVPPETVALGLSTFSLVLSRLGKEQLDEKQISLNQFQTKAIVEYLHTLLNWVSKLQASIDQLDQIRPALDYAVGAINDRTSHKDVLTQCAILFWSLLAIHTRTHALPFSLALKSLALKHDILSLFDHPQHPQDATQIQLQTFGIIDMARVRGFILAASGSNFPSELLTCKINDLDFFSYVLQQAEQTEGLTKNYCFHLIEAIFAKLKNLDNPDWQKKVSQLLIKFFEFPLHSVASMCETLMKRYLILIDQNGIQRLLQEVFKLTNDNLKAKYITLTLAMEHIEPIEFLEKNPGLIKETFFLSTIAVTTGKFVFIFLEIFLRKALLILKEENLDKWFEIWAPEFIAAATSEDEDLRTSVCNYVTPIVTNVNKNSLPYLMSSLLTQNSENMIDPLISLIKLARKNRILSFQELQITLLPEFQEQLTNLAPALPVFKIQNDDMRKLLLSARHKTCLDCFQVITLETKITESVTLFEYQMCEDFVQNCLRTTYPEHRTNLLKAFRQFMIRLRASLEKLIKNEPQNEKVRKLSNFLKRIVQICFEKLSLDKPIEAASPFFEVLHSILELFGDFSYKVKISQVYEPIRFLSTEKIFDEKSNFLFLVNSLKSTWSLVRQKSFDILVRYPKSFDLLNNDKDFAKELFDFALGLSQNPKAMMSEGSAFMLKLIFSRMLPQLELGGQTETEMQRQFLQKILATLKERVLNFEEVLFKQGGTSSLLHGLLSFFKHLFVDFQVEQTNLSANEFDQWSEFFKGLLQTCLEISQRCSNLLSNQGIIGESELVIDCRGHPITPQESQGHQSYEDYDNLVLVGVWLAVKENGLTLFNLLKWAQFPLNEQDKTKFFKNEDIVGLNEQFLEMLFGFKHRGAIEKCAECFSLFVQKLLLSSCKNYQAMPSQLLDQALQRISQENVSTILRRSAGIPPTIIAILRAEPTSVEPVLLSKAISFLLELVTNATTEDQKVHGLNILRYIFQDAYLKHDIRKFLTQAFMLATNSFSSESWNVRNSALMAFTALTKRLLETNEFHEQDLTKRKGLQTWDFFGRFNTLQEFFKQKLLDCYEGDTQNKEQRELVVFSLLLLLSRLVPSFHKMNNSEDEEENKQDLQELKTREVKIAKFKEIITLYAQNGTYFVRKIAAEALLPFIEIKNYLKSIQEDLAVIQKAMVKQNHCHGLIIRVDVFTTSLFAYTKQEDPEQIKSLIQSLKDALVNFPEKYSKVILSLLIKTIRFVLRNTMIRGQEWHELQNTSVSIASREFERLKYLELNSNEQVVLKQASKLLIENLELKEQTEFIKDFLQSFRVKHKDLTFKILKLLLKHQKSQLNRLSEISMFLMQELLPNLHELDHSHCKVIEYILKLIYLLVKNSPKAQVTLRETGEILQKAYYLKFKKNSNILAPLLKLMTLQAETLIVQDNPHRLDFEILQIHSYSDEKELVRIAAVKAIAKLLPVLSKKESLEGFKEYVKLLRACSLLLNDENPEIRSFVTLSLSKLLKAEFSIILSQKRVEITVNDYILHTCLLLQALEVAGQDQEKLIFTLKELVLGQITTPAYREHVQHNYEEKIFFFEPVNKFYDLVEVQQLAFQAFRKLDLKEVVKLEISEWLRQVSEKKMLGGIKLLTEAELKQSLEIFYGEFRHHLNCDNMQYEKLFANLLFHASLAHLEGKQLFQIQSPFLCQRLKEVLM